MVQPNEGNDLVTAWRALASSADVQGWRSISVATGTYCRLRAARRFPGNEEALLAGFHPVAITVPADLPQGNGFIVLTVDPGTIEQDRTWFALVRQPAGNLDMFTLMAADIVSALSTANGTDDGRTFRLFLDRIRAWQNFMQRGQEGLLSPEAEIGLHGELIFLADIISSGLDALRAVEAWTGPLRTLHDFQFGTGAVEIKTTILSGQDFPVKIQSLEQMDNSFAEPLYLAGMLLKSDTDGLNLQDRVNEIRRLIQGDSTALHIFKTLLLHAGYVESMADRYPRRFLRNRTRILRVDASFPALTRGNVLLAITRVHYEIDIDRINAGEVVLSEVLSSLGVK
jgi:hypothetical protein